MNLLRRKVTLWYDVFGSQKKDKINVARPDAWLFGHRRLTAKRKIRQRLSISVL